LGTKKQIKQKVNNKINLFYLLCSALLLYSPNLFFFTFSLFLLDLGRKSPYNEASQWEIASTMRKQQQQQQQQQQKTTKKTK
jgi:hypothetical protein